MARGHVLFCQKNNKFSKKGFQNFPLGYIIYLSTTVFTEFESRIRKNVPCGMGRLEGSDALGR